MALNAFVGKKGGAIAKTDVTATVTADKGDAGITITDVEAVGDRARPHRDPEGAVRRRGARGRRQVPRLERPPRLDEDRGRRQGGLTLSGRGASLSGRELRCRAGTRCRAVEPQHCPARGSPLPDYAAPPMTSVVTSLSNRETSPREGRARCRRAPATRRTRRPACSSPALRRPGPALMTIVAPCWPGM